MSVLTVPITLRSGLAADVAAYAAGSTVDAEPLFATDSGELYVSHGGVDYLIGPTVSNVTDDDYGDVTVASGVWTIDAGVISTGKLADGAVTTAKMASLSARSLLGRAAATSGVPGAIQALTANGAGVVAYDDDSETLAWVQSQHPGLVAGDGDAVVWLDAASLSADRVPFYDHSATAVAWLGVSGGVEISTTTLQLTDTAVTPGSYVFASITVDAKGRITAASNGSATALADAPAHSVFCNSGAGTGPRGDMQFSLGSGPGVLAFFENSTQTAGHLGTVQTGGAQPTGLVLQSDGEAIVWGTLNLGMLGVAGPHSILGNPYGSDAARIDVSPTEGGGAGVVAYDDDAEEWAWVQSDDPAVLVTDGETVSWAPQQAAVADATGAGDVVARLNDLLARLRTLGLIAT